MESKTKIFIGIILLALALGFGAGYFTKPSSVKTITVEKVVTEQAKSEIQYKVIYKEKTVKPDGTVTEIEKTDNTVAETSDTKSDTEKSTSQTIKNDIGLTISALAVANPASLTPTIDYGVFVSKRVFSNVSVGLMAFTDKRIGVGVGISFWGI